MILGTTSMHKAHKKHTMLIKPHLGWFSAIEVAILGTPCDNIRKIAFDIIESLSSAYKIAYVDADHKGAVEAEKGGFDPKSAITHGGSMQYTDKIHFNRIDWKGGLNPLRQKKYFLDQDLVIINGNHFDSDLQIAVIDTRKPLEKKLHKLTRVGLILLTDAETDIPEYLKAHIPEWSEIPVYQIGERSKIEDWIKSLLKKGMPGVSGLVLAGGKSTRMNSDKTRFNYHGKPQREFIWDLLSVHCDKVFLSCREDQTDEIDPSLNPLPDTFTGLGPFGGILSAFRSNPNSAWLTVASDMPLLDENMLRFLVENRDPSKTATAFWDPKHEFPEPLITIWEPRAYHELLYFLGLGYSCPRKALINSDVKLMEAPDKDKLMNVNYPEEYEAILKVIGEDRKENVSSH